MAAAYSIDLRKKILTAWQNKEGSQRELAKRFKVSLSFIRNFRRSLSRDRAEGVTTRPKLRLGKDSAELW